MEQILFLKKWPCQFFAIWEVMWRWSDMKATHSIVLVLERQRYSDALRLRTVLSVYFGLTSSKLHFFIDISIPLVYLVMLSLGFIHVLTGCSSFVKIDLSSRHYSHHHTQEVCLRALFSVHYFFSFSYLWLVCDTSILPTAPLNPLLNVFELKMHNGTLFQVK